MNMEAAEARVLSVQVDRYDAPSLTWREPREVILTAHPGRAGDKHGTWYTLTWFQPEES